MRPLHLMAAILPITLLAACGGGSGRTMATVETEPLPDLLIANTEQAAMLVGGEEPPTLASWQIQRSFDFIASIANTLLYSEIIDRAGFPEKTKMIDCTKHGICTGTFGKGPNVRPVEYTINVFRPGVLERGRIDGLDLVGYGDQNSVVMAHKGITLVQETGGSRTEDYRLEHRSYGGWLEHSAFKITSKEITDFFDGKKVTDYLIAHSFGKSSGRNPSASTTWEGVMVGATKDRGHIVHGDATVEFVIDTPDSVSVTLENIKNFDTNDDAATTGIAWPSVPLENGVFITADKSIEGHFYGNNLQEAGGVFSRDGLVGAFGVFDPAQWWQHHRANR